MPVFVTFEFFQKSFFSLSSGASGRCPYKWLGGGYLLRSQMHGLINKESTVVNSLLNLPELECQKSIARHNLVP